MSAATFYSLGNFVFDFFFFNVLSFIFYIYNHNIDPVL